MNDLTLRGLRTPALTGLNWESDAAYCPLCHCNKGGDAAEPNIRTEACERNACRCHDKYAVDLPFRCRCGAEQFATQDEQYAAQPKGDYKCSICRTFSTDHEFFGDESSDFRCYECDMRSFSHR